MDIETEWAVCWPAYAGDKPGAEIERHARRESAARVAAAYGSDGAALVSRTVIYGPWEAS